MNNYYLMDTPVRFNYLLDALEFYMSELLPKHKTLDISLVVQEYIDEDLNIEGFTENNDNLKRPREFIISLSAYSDNLLLTLAHECIHVKQYITSLEYNEDEAYSKEQELYDSFIVHSELNY